MTSILVVGAGIGGLTAALALSRAGVSVSLTERAAELREVGAGVQLSPNATRILAKLGLLDRLAAVALEPLGIRVRNGRSGRLLSFMSLEGARQRWGAPYLVVHRAELQSILAETVMAIPAVTLHLNTTFVGFGMSDTGVRTVVRQGQVTRSFESDALVGADGIRSAVRARLVDSHDTPQETGRTAWRALVPAESLDPALQAPETNLWLGPDAHLVHYPLDGGRQVNVVAIIREPSSATADLWSGTGEPTTIQRRFASWTRMVRDLVAAAPSWTTWPLFDRQPLSTWQVGRAALLGDAAHPILPFLAQGSAQAIEDAHTLAEAIAAERDVERALALYSRRRMPRVTQIQQASRQLGRIYQLSGVEGAARDLGMRLLGSRRLLKRYDWVYGG